MKILRALAGLVFIVSLAIFVATTFVRQGLLQETTWFAAVESSGVVEQFKELVVTTREKQAGSEAAMLVQKNLQLNEARRLIESNVTAMLAFIRGEREQLVFNFAQAGKYDVSAAAAQNPQVGQILGLLRIGYQSITIAWIASGIVAILALAGVYAAGERRHRLKPMAKLLMAGGVVTLGGAGLVWVVGKRLAGSALFPVDVAGERVYFDLSDLVTALIVNMTMPIVITGISLGVIGGLLLAVARRREPKVAVSIPTKLAAAKGTKVNKKILMGIAVIIVVGFGAYFYLDNRWTTYTSPDFGYEVSLPPGWEVDDSASSAVNRETTVIHPDGLAFVSIKAIKDDSLRAPEAVETALKQRVDGFAEQTNMTITGSSAKVESDTGFYIVQGTEKIEDKQWNFHERGLIGRSGKVLIFHGSADQSLGVEYLKTLSRIIESFRIE